MVGSQLLFAFFKTCDDLIVVLEQIFGFGEDKLGVLVCGPEMEVVLCRVAFLWLGGWAAEDVSKEIADLVVELRVEVFPIGASDQTERQTGSVGLQLSFFVVKQLVKTLLVLVYFGVHLVNPAVIFVLEVASHQQHLLAFDASLVFFLFGCAVRVKSVGICSALGRPAVW